jgi:hypothetical protein
MYLSSTGSLPYNVTFGVSPSGIVSPTILSFTAGTPFLFTDPQNALISQTATILYAPTGTISATSTEMNLTLPVSSYLADKKLIYAPVSTSSTSATLMFKVIGSDGKMIGTLDKQVTFTLALDQQISNSKGSKTMVIKDSFGEIIGSAVYRFQSGGKFIYTCTITNGSGAAIITSNGLPSMNTGNLMVSSDLSINQYLYFGSNNDWRIRTLSTPTEERLLFEYYDSENSLWVIGVPFIWK